MDELTLHVEKFDFRANIANLEKSNLSLELISNLKISFPVYLKNNWN
jgi:hypothetical protein